MGARTLKVCEKGGSWRIRIKLVGYRVKQEPVFKELPSNVAWVLSKAFEPTKPAGGAASGAASNASDTVGHAGRKLKSGPASSWTLLQTAFPTTATIPWNPPATGRRGVG